MTGSKSSYSLLAFVSLFGQAFEAAINRTKARAEFKYFSTNCKFMQSDFVL